MKQIRMASTERFKLTRKKRSRNVLSLLLEVNDLEVEEEFSIVATLFRADSSKLLWKKHILKFGGGSG